MKLYTFLLLIFYSTILIAQDQLTNDPLKEYNSFFENSFTLNMTRVNTNHTSFNVSGETFTFRKNDYLLTPEFRFNLGWLFHKPESKEIYRLRTGFNANIQRANLFDSDGNDLRLTSNYIIFPVDFSIRKPLTFRTVKDDLFRSVTYGLGGYFAAPFYQRLDHPDNIDAPGEIIFNYLRFGLSAEISLSALNEEGKGHKFGIRTSSDFTNLIIFGDTDNELYPYYINLGVFYNFSNDYYKKKSENQVE